MLGVVALLAAGCGGGEGSGEEADDPSEATGPTTTLEPQRGGKLIYGTEAETDGFDPARSRWAPSGFLMGFAVMDPLAYYDAEGNAKPYLAESIEPNETFDVWTITLRDGVKFHDDSDLDSADLIYLLDTHKASGLTQDSIRPIESYEAIDDLTVEITMSEPWVAFPAMLVSQIGAVPPEDYDVKWGPAANEPIGTGPFVYNEWIRDDHYLGDRNESYWREGLPRLDQIEFRPIPDAGTREAAFISGDIDVFHENDETRMRFYEMEKDGEAKVYESTSEGEELFVMLNTTRPPFDDVEMRRAMAHALPLEEYQALHGGGIDPIAYGAFQESNPFYEATPEYPQYDPAAAKEIVDAYVAGGGDPSFELLASSTPSNQRVLQWMLDKLEEVGMDPSANALTQSELILTVIGGNYDASYWRQFAGPDPDMDYVWWHGDNAKEQGEGLSLNMSRIDDEEINDALDRGRQSPDREDRIAAYADLQHRWAELVPYVWLSRPEWVVIAKPYVHSILTGPLPDGSPALALGGQYPTVHLLTHAWVDQ